MTDNDLIRRGIVVERLDLAEHDAEERDWRSGANELARIRKYVADLPAHVQPAPVAVDADHEEIGKAIWAAMLWAAQSKKLPEGMTYPEWGDDHDSQARKECTKSADRILSAITSRPVAEVQAEAVAGAYIAAASAAGCWSENAETDVLKGTPADAAAALDRIRAEARAAEARRIAEMVRGWRNTTPMTGEECADAILALIGGGNG